MCSLKKWGKIVYKKPSLEDVDPEVVKIHRGYFPDSGSGVDLQAISHHIKEKYPEATPEDKVTIILGICTF